MANPPEQPKNSSVTRRGLLLKEARELKGLSVETVHEMTKIPLDVLHAIEEGYTVRMVSAYYFKGFIKMYAKFLGIDSGLILDEPVPDVKPADEPKSVVDDPQHKKFNEYITRQSKKQTVINLVLLGILVILAAGIAGCWFKHPPAAINFPSVQIKKDQPVKKLIEAQTADRKMMERTKRKIKSPEAPVAKAAVSEEAAGQEVSPPPQPEQGKKKSFRKVTVTIKSHSGGWLQVKADGNLVFQSVLRTGATESWEADKSIELSGRNVNNLDFEVNGKMLGQLGKSDRPARRVLITAEGLSVRK